MDKKLLILMSLSFLFGSVLGGAFIERQYAAASLKKQPYMAVGTAINNAPTNTPSAVTKNVLAEKPLVAQAGKDDEKSQLLEQQIAQLTQTIQLQKVRLAHYETTLMDMPDDSFERLEVLFSEQPRNEAWAYKIETALSDFVVTMDLSPQPQMISMHCKSTVCQFKLATIIDSAHSADYWRNVSDALNNQPWWRQFVYTTVIHNNNEITYTVSTQ
jgi:hypothetical protein